MWEESLVALKIKKRWVVMCGCEQDAAWVWMVGKVLLD